MQVFPDILLANAYIILRPFFSLVGNPQGDILDVANWKFGAYIEALLFPLLEHKKYIVFIDLSNHDFPGIYSVGRGFTGPRPNPDTHPHM